MPILLALLGAYFSRKMDREKDEREQKEKQAELNREAKEKEQERAQQAAEKEKEQLRIEAEKQAELKRIAAEREMEEKRRKARREEFARQEVSKLVLTRVTHLARAYYLPFVGVTKSLLNEADKLYIGSPEADKESSSCSFSPFKSGWRFCAPGKEAYFSSAGEESSQ
jgi:hypothetical protein